MLKKFKTLASLYRELGLRWSAFRFTYAFRLHMGLIRWQMPKGEWKEYQNHVGARHSPEPVEGTILPIPKEIPEDVSWNKQTAIDEADRILNGELKYFAHEWIITGFLPGWHKQEPSGISTDSAKHWSLISDDYVVASLREAILNHEETASASAASQRHGDIKFIWEPNRFSFFYTLVRAYVATDNEKYPEAYWSLIEDWAKHNPPNTGPNWMDGQEIALRLMAWTFGYYAFRNSPSSASDRKANFTLYVAAQAERIYKNIGYAISTKSNHTISEAFGLWMVGLLYPELKQADKYTSLGRKLLEQEAAAQIFPDGTYSMYSLNYHRFVLHIYLYAIRLGELNHVPFSDTLKRKVSSSIEYLSQLIDYQTGQMPVYGSNDGALVLPSNNCSFTDYRPLLQLGWYVTKKEFLFEPGPWDEDIFWLCGGEALIPSASPEGRREPESPSPSGRGVRGEGKTSFPHGGVYILRGNNSKALIRCTDFRARPSHADQLHVDLWLRGQNIAVDAGTYLYSGEGMWRNGLARTSVHNTVIVDNNDQMTMVSRFTWTNWSKGHVLNHEKNLWQGQHNSYKPVSHQRTVMALDNDRWLVIDHLLDKKAHHYALHWLLADCEYGVQELSTPKGYAPARFGVDLNYLTSKLFDSKIKMQLGLVDGHGSFSLVRADPNSTRGWRSQYYGHKEPALSLVLKTEQPRATFWTFFGFDGDVVELQGKMLKVGSAVIDLK